MPPTRDEVKNAIQTAYQSESVSTNVVYWPFVRERAAETLGTDEQEVDNQFRALVRSREIVINEASSTSPMSEDSTGIDASFEGPPSYEQRPWLDLAFK